MQGNENLGRYERGRTGQHPVSHAILVCGENEGNLHVAESRLGLPILPRCWLQTSRVDSGVARTLQCIR